MHYDIKYCKENVDWKSIPCVEMTHTYLNTPDTISAYAQAVWNEDGIRLHLCTKEPETRAVENSTLGNPCEDSCLEFFISPMENDKRYMNVEFNSNGCVFTGMGSDGNTLMRFVSAENEPLITPNINKFDGGWEIFYTLPCELITRLFPEFTLYEGKKARGNFFKCSDLGNFPHYLSWSKITREPFTFHYSECFGSLSFVK